MSALVERWLDELESDDPRLIARRLATWGEGWRARAEFLEAALKAASGGLGMIGYSRGVGPIDMRDMARGFKAEVDAALREVGSVSADIPQNTKRDAAS